MRTRTALHVVAALSSILAPASSLSAQQITFSFNGLMQGNSIFAEGTPFAGSFTYVYPQTFSPSGAYLLESYNLTIEGESLPIPPASSLLGGSIPIAPFAGTSWNGAIVNNGEPSISVSNATVDSFVVKIESIYPMFFRDGFVRLGGPAFTLSDSSGGVFDDASLPDLRLIGNQLTSGQISIRYSVDGGSGAIQTGTMTSIIPEPSTYALLLMTGAGALWWARRRR